MENLWLGILTISISTACIVISLRYFKRNSLKIALLFLLFNGLVLRIFVASDPFLHAWDERYHALVAKNLIKHPLKPTLYDNPLLDYDYRNWTSNHVWVHKQPVPLWSIAFSLWLFGLNEIAVRLPSVLLTTIGILIVFKIALFLYNTKVAYIAAFLYSIHGLIIALAGGRYATDHIDIFFLFFISLAVLWLLQYIKTKKQIFNILSGLSVGLAVLSKWLPAFIVFPVWLLLVIDSGKFKYEKILIDFTILILVTCLTFIPWQLYIHMKFPMEAAYENSFNMRHITEGLEGHGKPFWFHFLFMGKMYGELFYIAAIWFIYKVLKKPLRLKRLALLVWFMVPFIFFSFPETKLQAYTLFAAPAIFIITGMFWVYLYRFRHRFRSGIIPALLLVLLLVLPIRYNLEKTKILQIRERRPDWVVEIKKLIPAGEAAGGKLVIFNTEHPIEMMFYVDCVAYPFVPEQHVIADLEKKGYRVVMQ